VEISCRVYRPRRPRESPLFRLVERHIEELLRVWPERFLRQHGPLRPVVERVLRAFIACGDVAYGFARLWCPECRRSVLVAFSCRGRSFCPSCEKKRQILWAEWLCKEVLEKLAHRHVVLTIPRLLRPFLRRRRELLTELGRAGAEAVSELVRRGLGGDARPGIVVSIATSGDLVQWHPHVHLLTTDGGKTAEGSWQPLPEWDGVLLMTLFRERLLARLLEKRATCKSWSRSCLPGGIPDFRRTSVTRSLPRTGAVLYRSRMNPFLGRNFEAMGPLEWLARLRDHIPDPGQHRTLFHGEYSNRVRGSGESHEPEIEKPQEEKPRKRCLPTWARLIAKVYHVDPLVCTRCGKRMSIAGFVTDTVAIGRILEHLGLSTPEAEKPPPVKETARRGARRRLGRARRLGAS
jgi:Transposase zinc-binding domain